MRRFQVLVCALMLVTFGILASPASATIFVGTGHTGAQVQTDIDHTRFWTYSVSADVADVDGALLTMKVGSQTSENITFSIIEGTFADYGIAPALLSVTLTPSAFTQSFAYVAFQATTPINLQANKTYTGILASSAHDPQDEAYFIKQSNLFFVDGSGNPTIPDGGGTIVPGDTNVPEPGALILLAATMPLLIRRRR